MAECVNTVNRVKTVGGTAENMYLPDAGIRGNSHMLMMDVNNQQLAGMILVWLNRNAPVRRESAPKKGAKNDKRRQLR